MSRAACAVPAPELRAAKSILYAALEQVRTQADHLSSVHRLLREIFVLIYSQAGLAEHERWAVMMAVEDLEESYGFGCPRSDQACPQRDRGVARRLFSATMAQ